MRHRRHLLRTWPEPFKAVASGAKTFEFREDDRGFMVGDLLRLQHWDPSTHVPGSSRGDWVCVARPGPAELIDARVTYILHGGRFGVPEGYCVMAFEIESSNVVCAALSTAGES